MTHFQVQMLHFKYWWALIALCSAKPTKPSITTEYMYTTCILKNSTFEVEAHP